MTEQMHTPLNTPIKLSNKEAWPFDLVVLDAAGVAILSERRAAHSSRDRTVEDLMDAVHFHREGREAAREANHEQLARWEFIVAAVNSFASSQERIAQLEALKVKAQRYYELLRECQVESGTYGATGLVETIEATLSETMCATCNGNGMVGGLVPWGDGEVDSVCEPCPECCPERIVGAAPEPEGEWIDWTGGECPVPGDTPVTVSFRTGYTCEHSYAYEWVWSHSAKGNGSDIIAYRIVGAAK